MTFKEAFEAMKHGAKVKLPGWNGYWCWDDEKQTIMIHCRPKDSDKGQEMFLIFVKHREWNILSCTRREMTG